MASQKISDFSVITTLASGDYFPVVQNSDTSNKRVTTKQIFEWVPVGSAAAPSLAFDGNNTGLFRPGVDQIGVSSNGIQTVFIDTNGDVSLSGVLNSPVTNVEYLFAASGVLFLDADLSNYVGLKSPATVASNVLWTLPDADGSAGQVISTDGASNLDWVTPVTLSGSQTLTDKTLTDPAIEGTILEDVYTITDGAAFEVDPGNGSVQLITLGANRTPLATNFAAGESVTLMVDDGTAYTITWTDTTWGPSGVIWTGGNAPTLATSGYTVIQLWKVGSQVYGASVGDVA